MVNVQDLYAPGMDELIMCPMEIASHLNYDPRWEFQRPRWIWEALNILWPWCAEEICSLFWRPLTEPYVIAAYIHGAADHGRDLRPTLIILMQDAGAMAW